MNDFPEFDSFQDYRGKDIKFKYDVHNAGHIFALRAREVTKSKYPREFCAYDTVSPLNALLKMRQKIPQELNTRYFSEEKGRPFDFLNFDHFRGNITTDTETQEACLVVDGKKMSMTDLEQVFSTYEGRQIEIRITEE